MELVIFLVKMIHVITIMNGIMKKDNICVLMIVIVKEEEHVLTENAKVMLEKKVNVKIWLNMTKNKSNMLNMEQFLVIKLLSILNVISEEILLLLMIKITV
jgi:hypothetical protein